MPWWKKPFTLILVPHDGSNTHSFTIKGLSFLLMTLFLSVIIGVGSFFFVYGMVTTSSSVKNEKLKEKLVKLRKQNRRYKTLNKNVASLQSKLKKTEKLQQSILRLSGLNSLNQPEDKSNSLEISETDSTKRKLEKTSKTIQNQSNRNDKLKSVKRFVKSRNKVLKHTPILWPVDGWLSSSYGLRKDPMGGKGQSFHEGVDLAAWHESPIRAPADGKVVQSNVKSGYGNTVKIKHKYGYKTVYGHLAERLVRAGETVQKGDLIGRVGSTGHSTGSHLHYEVRVNGNAVNPWPYLVQNYDSFESAIAQEAIAHAGN